MLKVNNSYLIYFDTFLQFSILYVLRNLIINQIPYFSDIHHECPQVLQNILIHNLENKTITSGQCSHFIPPENTSKPSEFWRF